VVAGLRYIPEYIDQSTHDRLMACVDAERWLTSVDHGVQIYGYNYSHVQRAAIRIGELPAWAHDLAACLWRDGLMPSMADQLVANEYHPGAGFFAHIDQAVFGDTVASVSLGSTCVMQFIECETGRTEELLLERRSVLLLSGEARWAWKHGIPARTVDPWLGTDVPRSRRVSLTFRAMPVPTRTPGENHG
jgi:alkylated DNA repair dioxygenase AlkB